MTRNRFQKGRVPLNRALSKLGIASRTVAQKWIESGLVRVDGVLRKDPDFMVIPETARIEVAEREIKSSEFKAYLLYKPKGVITTRKDEKGRPTVFSLIREPESHLIAVGRLDWATTGLLILTNDTQMADWLTHPHQGIPRVYLVTVRGKIDAARLAQLQGGIRDKDETLQADQIVIRKASERETHLVVTLSEGKNREIRRMFLALGNEVTRLKRISYGKLELGDLKPGEYRELTATEIQIAFPGVPLKTRPT